MDGYLTMTGMVNSGPMSLPLQPTSSNNSLMASQQGMVNIFFYVNSHHQYTVIASISIQCKCNIAVFSSLNDPTDQARLLLFYIFYFIN